MARGTLKPDALVSQAIVGAFLAGSVLVLVATRGRHPGWIGLLAVAALSHLGTT
jgi:hypothetical protein